MAAVYFNNLRDMRRTWWLMVGLCFVLFLLLYAPNLVRQGMFFDGLWYASIARNLAAGVGSFWAPSTSLAGDPFFSHPPLVFVIQSRFFSWFGDHIAVERAYCLLVMLLTLVGITWLWRLIFQERPALKRWAVLPVLIWLVNETNYFAYVNNLLEPTLGLFTLAATLLLWGGARGSGDGVGASFLAAACVWLAVLSKGPFGLFPLAFWPLYGLVFHDRPATRVIWLSVVTVAFFLLIGFCLLFWPDAREFFTRYYDTQIADALAGQSRENLRESRFHILNILFQRHLPALGLVVLIGGLCLWRKIPVWTGETRRLALFFLLYGLAGVIPIMVSLKQVSHYAVPVLPYLAIALAAVIVAGWNRLLEGLAFPRWLFASLGILLLAAGIYGMVYIKNQWGLPDKRDRDLLADIHLIGTAVGYGEQVNISPDFDNQQALGLLNRYYAIHTDTVKAGMAYRLVDGSNPILPDTAAFTPILPGTTKLTLLKEK